MVLQSRNIKTIVNSAHEHTSHHFFGSNTCWMLKWNNPLKSQNLLHTKHNFNPNYYINHTHKLLTHTIHKHTNKSLRLSNLICSKLLIDFIIFRIAIDTHVCKLLIIFIAKNTLSCQMYLELFSQTTF